MAKSRTPERSLSLPEEVARVLREEILSGAFAPGHRLPTEQKLSERFNVSRPVIREAVSRLKYDGLVASHQGRGAFVTPLATRRAFRIEPAALSGHKDLSEVFELRMTLEAEAAAMAALRRKKAHLSVMGDAIAAMQDAVQQRGDGAEADAAFHKAVAAATGNAYFLQFMEFLQTRVYASISASRHNLLRDPARAEIDVAEHMRIRDAIADRDSAAARAEMLAHLTNAARDLKLGKRLLDHVDQAGR